MPALLNQLKVVPGASWEPWLLSSDIGKQDPERLCGKRLALEPGAGVKGRPVAPQPRPSPPFIAPAEEPPSMWGLGRVERDPQSGANSPGGWSGCSRSGVALRRGAQCPAASGGTRGGHAGVSLLPSERERKVSSAF